MARIEAVPERKAGLLGRFAYRFSRRRFGEVTEPLTVTAHHPRLLFGYGMIELALDRSCLVDERLKHFAVLKAAAMVGCEFCIDIGSTLARYSGVTEDQLRNLSNYEGSEAFSPLEKLVLDYAAAITRTPTIVSQDLFDALRKHFDEASMVELTVAIALENYRARFNHAFGIGSQGFSDGAYCPVPEVPDRP
ncbi:MAG TPA: carboxymuconolactone decarboxylase family protein [Rubrobacteraceae bacterium]|nr:carboxymuconolactone decarboxylase family protein [Rubrobacteraceae bacterium]